MSYASTSDQHRLYTLTPVAMYDSTTTFYYVIVLVVYDIIMLVYDITDSIPVLMTI